MPPHDLIQLDHRGVNLRHLSSWQDGDGGPVDGEPLPGKVRIKMSPEDTWDLEGEAAERFRAAIRQAAWTPPRDSVHTVQARNYDPRTGEPLENGGAGIPPGDRLITETE